MQRTGDVSTKTGIVFDIKEFSLFDGPGIRETVFLKGCPLRCSWCHNPEGLSMEPEIMVSAKACVHCGKCKEVCEHPDECVLCRRCVALCPQNARRVAGEIMTSGQLIDVIREDAGYYGSHGGGVTFSGGEPLLQAEFLLEVLQGIPDVHRAIETSGYADAGVFDAVLASLDYVMMDIKVMDDEIHRQQTGRSNRRVLRNAKTLMESGKPCKIRVPLIPGISDTEKNIRETAQFIRSVSSRTPVELLPYHVTAGAKYPMVGREYLPRFDTDRKVQIHRHIFEEYGLECSVL